MTVAMDDWAEAVRKAIEDDPDQPDRALLARIRGLEAIHAPSDAIANLRREMAESMASMRSLVLNAHPVFSHLLFGVYLGLFMWGGLWLRDASLRAIFPLRAAGSPERAK